MIGEDHIARVNENILHPPEAQPRKGLRSMAGKPEAFRYVLRPSRKATRRSPPMQKNGYSSPNNSVVDELEVE
jgi:hypothetical protein